MRDEQPTSDERPTQVAPAAEDRPAKPDPWLDDAEELLISTGMGFNSMPPACWK